MNDILKKRIEKAADYVTQTLDEGTFKEACRSNFMVGAKYGIDHQWISVKEALPEPEEEVVLFNKNSIRHYEIGWLRKEKECSKSKWAITNGFVEDDDITHWMPIPKFETKDKEDKQ